MPSKRFSCRLVCKYERKKYLQTKVNKKIKWNWLAYSIHWCRGSLIGIPFSLFDENHSPIFHAIATKTIIISLSDNLFGVNSELNLSRKKWWKCASAHRSNTVRLYVTNKIPRFILSQQSQCKSKKVRRCIPKKNKWRNDEKCTLLLYYRTMLQ